MARTPLTCPWQGDKSVTTPKCHLFSPPLRRPGDLSGQPSSPRELPGAAPTLPQLLLPRKNPPELPGTNQGRGHQPSPSSAAGTRLAARTAPGLLSRGGVVGAAPPPGGHTVPARVGRCGRGPSGRRRRGTGSALRGSWRQRTPPDASGARPAFSESRDPQHARRAAYNGGVCSDSHGLLRKPALPRPSSADAQPERRVGPCPSGATLLLTSASGSAFGHCKLIIRRRWL